MTGVRGIDHVNLRAPAQLIQRLRSFYIDLIGLREGPRPTFRSGSRGYWLYAGDSPIMHLTISDDGDAQPRSTGWLSHYAFECSDLPATRARLDAAGVRYETDVVADISQIQLFLVDPAGVEVELNFRMTE